MLGILREVTLDKFSNRRRSEIMSNIRSKDTSPELAVRRLVRKLGIHCTTHSALLPGKPDLVFRRRHKVIFVHGCFWHQHTKCSDGRKPKSNRGYWWAKLNKNVQRDRKNKRLLNKLGWKTLTIWDCDVSNPKLSSKIAKFLTT